MNWKEFLKPDWRKVIGYSILVLLFSYFLGWYFYNSLRILTETFCHTMTDMPCLPEETEFYKLILIGLIELYSLGTVDSTINILTPVFLALHIIFYLISCMIVQIFDKKKKKVKKR